MPLDRNENISSNLNDNKTEIQRRYSHALIVDDDPFFSKVLGKQLTNLGISEISKVENGELAIQQITREQAGIDLVFCDLKMPTMDGIAFLRCLAETTYKGRLVLMSGQSERVMASVNKLADAHGIKLLGTLGKPFKLSEIEQLLISEERKRAREMPQRTLLSREDVISGLASGAVESFFQPQVDMKNGSVVGAEVLMRWRDGEGQLIPPLYVIPTAEQHGLIDQLTEIIFKKAVDQVSAWKSRGLNIPISINLSMENLQKITLFDNLLTHTQAAGIQPESITLEITESRLAADMRGPLELMGRFKLMGYSLSIDDFGTGYSSMEQLSGFPFDELKIDRQFVSTALRDSTSLSIIESSITLAKKLSMRVVAEGVETREEWQLMRKKGCDLAQGFLISKPLPADEFEYWYTHWDGRQFD